MVFNLPPQVDFIIKRMKQHGKRADIVGGCVRDILHGRSPDDFDITTDATPDETKEIFSDFRVIETGIAHGTVTVVVEGDPYEITTYRVDGGYSDGRHPDSVTFTSRLEEDLSRRDFTVNAMCYNPDYGITDLHSGRADLDSRLIRAVGVAEQRFSEDALRILRAIRFASVLGFDIESATASAVKSKAHLLSEVSAERIYTEFKKLLHGVGAIEIIKNYESVITVFLPELSGVAAELCRYPDLTLSPDTPTAIATLFALVSPTPAAHFDVAMRRLKTDNRMRESGCSILANYTSANTDTDCDLVHLLSTVGYDAAKGILALRLALGKDTLDKRHRLAELKDEAVYRLRDLDISGNDLTAVGFSGKKIGEALSRLLDAVIDGKVENEKEKLIAFIKQ